MNCEHCDRHTGHDPLCPALDFKTQPLAHQLVELMEHRDKVARGLFWEMGLGKSWIMLVIASYLHRMGKIDALVVIAPNSCYANWIRNEAPRHMVANYIGLVYPKTDSQEDTLRRLIFTDPTFEIGRLRVVAIGFEAVASTDRAMDFLTRFMKIHRTMLVIDESTAIKNPKTNTARRVKKLGAMAKRRWILTGTPVANSPFDIHSQVEFLNPEFWGWHGLKAVGAFRAEFGVFVSKRVGNRVFPKLKTYRALDKLHDIVSQVSSRLMKESSGVVLPPKLYELKTFDMTKKQREIYDGVKRHFRAELDDGLEVDAVLAISRLIRLHQIASGFVTAEQTLDEPAPGEDAVEGLRLLLRGRVLTDIVDFADNPRLQLLADLIDQCCHKVIVVCRFTREIDQICERLGPSALRFDGQVTDNMRKWTLERFQDPTDVEHKVLVAQINALSHGHTFLIAKTTIHYSRSYSLERELQVDDRADRIGQDGDRYQPGFVPPGLLAQLEQTPENRPAQHTLIIDIAAENSVDLKLLERLKSKSQVSAEVLGDVYREWILADD